MAIAVVWLFLFAVDMAEDSGLIPESGAEADQSIDAVLADFGEAIKISVDPQIVVSPVSTGRSAGVFPGLARYSVMPVGPGGAPADAGQRTLPLKQTAKSYRLYKVFRI